MIASSPGRSLVTAAVRPFRVRISALSEVGAAGESRGRRKLRVNDRMSIHTISQKQLDQAKNRPERFACLESDLIFVLSKRHRDCPGGQTFKHQHNCKGEPPDLPITSYAIPQLGSSSSPTIFPDIFEHHTKEANSSYSQFILAREKRFGE